jgi:hypothetical protein
MLRPLYGAIIATLLTVAIVAAPAAAIEPTHTQGDSDCDGKFIDPINVRWFNVSDVGLAANLTTLLTRWGPVGGKTQWLRGGNGCHAQHYSMGREFGRKTNAVRHREKAHVRIFETGEGQLAGDAHRERKVACDDDGKQNDDAVYPRFDGKSGFDAAMDQMVRAFRRSNGWVVTMDTLRGPYVHSFRQCDRKWVTWSGDIAYMTRMGP